MKNEAIHLQQMMANCQRPAKVLAITSGKGGVGKTNIAANLGVCLAASQKKVLLFDADLSLGNLDIILNINSKYNISHMINRSVTRHFLTLFNINTRNHRVGFVPKARESYAISPPNTTQARISSQRLIRIAALPYSILLVVPCLHKKPEGMINRPSASALLSKAASA